MKELKELEDDINQFQLALEDFENLLSNDGETAFELAKLFIHLADRWSEIQIQSKKYANELGITKSQFYDYAYHKYSLAKEMHITCRSCWRNCKEDLRNGFQDEL